MSVLFYLSPQTPLAASIVFAVMAPSLAAIAESIQRQTASKWLWHVHHLASCLRISTAELKEFIKRIQSGGSGVRQDGTWTTNPAPYNRKINLTNHQDNSLNLHLVESRSKKLDSSTFVEPSPDVVVRILSAFSFYKLMSYYEIQSDLIFKL